jgi:hypothetical protein
MKSVTVGAELASAILFVPTVKFKLQFMATLLTVEKETPYHGRAGWEGTLVVELEANAIINAAFGLRKPYPFSM